ncbi:MAG: DUF3696 domain-containing protein [Campylobacterota bacterium]|nr:DUF3696 domain-containing protein [Campylobacterota bacterium]
MKIDRVKVKNFKSLRDVDLTLSNLTLLSGVNSSGKSSFIQSLLLLNKNLDSIMKVSYYQMMKKLLPDNQTILQEFDIVNSNTFISMKDIGNYKDILYQDSYNENIDVNIYNIYNYFKVSFNSTLKLSLIHSELKGGKGYNLFFKDFQYICTDRISPQINFPLSEEHIENNLIGIYGEYTAHYIAENKNKKLLIKNLKHKKSKTNQLLENTSLWLNEISENIDIDVTVNPSQNNVTLTYSYIYENGKTNKYNSLNVGFGITYVLPIIVAILKSKPDDLLIIENPESHLHPAGQAKIAELCAIASSCGVQIIVETHSDHFLNAIRVATKKEILKPEDSSIYYFRKDMDELETKIDKINIDKYGNIDNYPKGFFDEWDNKLDELLGL